MAQDNAHISTIFTTAAELADDARRCAALTDDVGAAVAIRALRAIDQVVAALVAAEVFGDNTEWL